RKLSQDARERHPDDAEILWMPCCLVAEERDAQGAPLGCGKRVQDVVADPLEEIPERSECELRLRFRGAALEDGQRAAPRLHQADTPGRCLSNTGLAGQDQRGRARRPRGDEVTDRVELTIPADGFRGHLVADQIFAGAGADIEAFTASWRIAGLNRALVKVPWFQEYPDRALRPTLVACPSSSSRPTPRRR